MKYLTFVSAVFLCSMSYASQAVPCQYEADMFYAAKSELYDVEVKSLLEAELWHLDRKVVDAYLAETCLEEIQSSSVAFEDRLSCKQIDAHRPSHLNWFAVKYSVTYSDVIEDHKELLGMDKECRVVYKKSTFLYQNFAD